MKFNDFPYQRPDFEKNKNELSALVEKLKNSNSAKSQHDTILAIEKINEHITSMFNLASIRHTVDSLDEFYDKENAYWDEIMPLYQELKNEYYDAVLASPYLDELKTLIPETYFKLAEFTKKSFDPSVIEQLQEENKLVSAYNKLIASAQIEFDGEVYTLSQLGPLTQSPDRNLRKRAAEARYSFFEEHEAELDRIYDELVHLRHNTAVKLGFDNYIELVYLLRFRFDYNQAQVANFRKQVLEYFVPLASKLYNEQAGRIGLDSLQYYDLSYKFEDGNPTPKGSPEEMVSWAQEMYHELSEESGEFFDFMVEHELLDLVAKKGKNGGGYCTYLPDFKAPFIFSNFNGTQGDVEVLTHEAGHALQVYQSRWIPYTDILWPSYESCEIHSMGMEYLTWPWMHKFFQEDTTKFLYTHLADNVQFLPYGVLVDHFQHEVFSNPDMTAEQRKASWRRLEKLYNPHKDYSENAFLDKGSFWFQQAHIFTSPFYYIDYTLAEICAMQFFVRMRQDDPNVLKDYLHICSLGGTKSFVSLVKEANLISPFEDGCVKSVISSIEESLNELKESL